MYNLLEYAFPVIATALALIAGKAMRAGRYYVIALAVCAAAAAVVAVYLGYSAIGAAFPVGFALVSFALSVSYMRHTEAFGVLLLLLIAGFAAYALQVPATSAIGFFGIGAVCGLMYRDTASRRSSHNSIRDNKRRETGRDIVQISLGIVVAAVLLLLPMPYSAYLVFALMLFGYFMNSFFLNGSRGVYGKALAALERSDTTYGIGAMYLAAGTSLVVGFSGSSGLMLFGIVALFFADSAATIIGMRLGRHRIPYNRDKTFEGALSFFLILALLGIPLLGPYALPLAAALAFLESVRVHVDDNMRTGIAIALIGIALRA